MKRALVLFLIFLILLMPVNAATVGEFNPTTESVPLWCRFVYTRWLCDFGGTGATGPQGPPGENATTDTVNYYNLTAGNLTTISNFTYFYDFSQMNQTINMTANMTAGPQGEQGIQGIQGIQGEQGEIGLTGPMNQTANMTANMTAGPQGEQGIQGEIGPIGPINLTANMTAGPIGPIGPINLTANMTAGPIGPVGPMNQTANMTANMTAGATGATGGTGGQVLFFHHDPVEEPEGYEGLYPIPAGTTEADETVIVQTGTGQVLVDPYITIAGYPGLTTLPAGLWRFRTFHYVNSAPGDTNAVFKVYNRSGATETLLFTATSEDINALEATEYLTSYVQTEDYTVALTDRIVIKVYGQSDHSSNINFHFVYEGVNHTSHVQTPLETSSTLYIRHDGSVDFTGSQSMGGYNLTNVLDPVAAQDAATKNYVDTRPVINNTYDTISNVSTYVIAVNTSMKDYVDAKPVINSSYDTISNVSTYVIAVNTSMKDYVDARPIINESYVTTDNETYFLTDGSRAMVGNISMSNNYINDLLDPSQPQDAATKNYCDIAIEAKQKCGASTWQS